MAIKAAAMQAPVGASPDSYARVPSTGAEADEVVHPIGPARAEQLAEILRALGHPLRLRLMGVLCREPMHVGALAAELGVAQVTVSQQLRILRLTRLVDVTRKAGQARYRLAEPHLRTLFVCLSRVPGAGQEDR